MKVEDPTDSLSKLLSIMERVTALGAHAYPVLLGGSADAAAGGSEARGVALVPLHSWFQPDFLGERMSAREHEMGRMLAMEGAWPRWLEAARQKDGDAVSRFFAELNRSTMADALGRGRARVVPLGTPLVTFSHFLPETGLHRGTVTHYIGG